MSKPNSLRLEHYASPSNKQHGSIDAAPTLRHLGFSSQQPLLSQQSNRWRQGILDSVGYNIVLISSRADHARRPEFKSRVPGASDCRLPRHNFLEPSDNIFVIPIRVSNYGLFSVMDERSKASPVNTACVIYCFLGNCQEPQGQLLSEIRTSDNRH